MTPSKIRSGYEHSIRFGGSQVPTSQFGGWTDMIRGVTAEAVSERVCPQDTIDPQKTALQILTSFYMSLWFFNFVGSI